MYQTIAERLWSDPAPGIWKSQPQDFQVEELWTPPSTEDGEGQQKGEHVLLLIEKAGQNTQWVARQIARYAGVRDMDIGFHGLKDRHALTRQWLSGIHRQGVRTTRRAFSVMPENLSWNIDETTVNLQFDLVPGAYASVLLDQVFDLRTAAFGQADS